MMKTIREIVLKIIFSYFLGTGASFENVDQKCVKTSF